MNKNKPHKRLNSRIRYLNKELKHLRNAKKAYFDEAVYHQAVIDSISEEFSLTSKES